MVKLSENEIEILKKTEIDLLVRIKKIFESNNLRYVALHGTLLGTIRHNGFIPWDDDIDLGMPRSDYNFMIEHFDELFPNDIGLVSPENTKHYEVMFAKIHDKKTTYIELGMMDKPDRYTGVFIDIFPLDGVPSDKKCQAEFKKNYQKYMFWNYKLRFSIKDVHTIRAKILHFVTAPLRGILPYDYYYKKYIGMISKNDFDTSEFWTYPTTVYRHNYIYRKQIFNDILDHDFENIKIAIPTGYDEFLSQSFGDYMKLPPEEDRIPHHYADFVSFEIPYEEYRR